MTHPVRRLLIALLLLFANLMPVLSNGCRPRPQILCVMEHPATGQQVKMHRESRLKVPADYDEHKHIEEWKAEQRKRGFTLEVKP